MALPAGLDVSAAADEVARALLRRPELGLPDVLSFDPALLDRAERRLAGQEGTAAALLLMDKIREEVAELKKPGGYIADMS